MLWGIFQATPKKRRTESPTPTPEPIITTPFVPTKSPFLRPSPTLAIPTEFEPTMAFEKTFKEYRWEEIGLNLPTGVTLSPVPSGLPLKKDSPSLKHLAELTGNQLIVSDHLTGEKTTINFENKMKGANFTWLNDNYLILIEKEDDFWSVDKIYFVERGKSEKILITGSFPIKNRLNLDLNPTVNPEGNEIFFADNGGVYWKLVLIYQ